MDQLLRERRYTTWQLIKLYWKSEQKRYAYFAGTIILLMTLSMVAFDVIFSYWFNYFYNALQAYDKKMAVNLLMLFFVLAGLYIVLAVYRYYISQLFGLKWRRW